MVLILGGFGAGKRAYVQSLGYSDADMSADVRSDAPVLVGLEEIVRNDPESAKTLLPRLLEKKFVLCCEVGSGVIPMDAADALTSAYSMPCVNAADDL